MTEREAVRGLVEAERLYGRPVVRCIDLGDYGDQDRFWEMWQKRQAEVVLVLQRPDECVILQTKEFYPNGVFRLPTGGVKAGEDLVSAVGRELMEETGLPARIRRFAGILRYHFRRHGEPMTRESYVFLLEAGAGELRPQDEAEEIAGFREVPSEELKRVAAQLDGLPGEWATWGRFRALVHRFVAARLVEDGAVDMAVEE